jgi:imipenem/basic amino acid-specific outer membrane pore
LNNKILMIVAFLLVVNTLQAEEDKRERLHSVREVVDSAGELQSKDIAIVESVKLMFSDGKISGQIRTMYTGYKQKQVGTEDTYATAVGGVLKYELAEFKGFNAGVALYASRDIGLLTGDGTKQNNELSSTDGSYVDLAEAYVNYSYKDLNIRLGRQTLDTPLADSDDIRIIQNTFNAYVLSFAYQGIDFTAGHIVSWQGVDAGLDAGWSRVADKTDGTNFGGITYNDGLEFGLWYYNMTKQANATYVEFGGNHDLNKDMQVHAMIQYLHESEHDSSGIGADIYGALFEFIAYNIGFHIAYDKANKKTGLGSFSGLGGGTLYTSMDTMILDNIAVDRDAEAIVAGVTYSYDKFGFLYAYGDFDGDADAVGTKTHIVEQDMGVEYNINESFLISAIYVISEDKLSSTYTSDDWNRLQLMINYNF